MGIPQVFNEKLAAFSGILLQEGALALGLHEIGAGTETIVLIASGVAIISAEVAVRLGIGKDDGGSGSASSSPTLATA